MSIAHTHVARTTASNTHTREVSACAEVEVVRCVRGCREVDGCLNRLHLSVCLTMRLIIHVDGLMVYLGSKAFDNTC